MTTTRMKLSRLGAFYRRGGAIALFPLIFALALGFGQSITNEEIRLLDNDGVDTTATVISTYEQSDTSGRRGTRTTSTNYFVQVQFVGPDERTLRRSAKVSESFQRRVEEGDVIPVRYVKQDTSLVEIDPARLSSSAYWVTVAGLVMVAWLIGMIWHYWRESAKTYRAVNRGEMREAHVTGHVSDANPRVKDTRKEGRRRYMLKWRDAEDNVGMGGSLGKDKLAKYPEGTVIVTYTDPVSREVFWEGQI